MTNNEWKNNSRFIFEIKQFDDTLKTKFATKHKLFKNNFFSIFEKIEFDDIKIFEYFEFVSFFILTFKKTKNVIKNNHFDHVVKSNILTFKIFQLIFSIIDQWITKIYNAYVNLTHISILFRHTNIIIFRKIDKNDYIDFKSYRFIVFMNILKKNLKKIIITKFVHVVKKKWFIIRRILRKQKIHFFRKRISHDNKNNSRHLKIRKKFRCHVINNECFWNFRLRCSFKIHL